MCGTATTALTVSATPGWPGSETRHSGSAATVPVPWSGGVGPADLVLRRGSREAPGGHVLLLAGRMEPNFRPYSTASREVSQPVLGSNAARLGSCPWRTHATSLCSLTFPWGRWAVCCCQGPARTGYPPSSVSLVGFGGLGHRSHRATLGPEEPYRLSQVTGQSPCHVPRAAGLRAGGSQAHSHRAPDHTWARS